MSNNNEPRPDGNAPVAGEKERVPNTDEAAQLRVQLQALRIDFTQRLAKVEQQINDLQNSESSKPLQITATQEPSTHEQKALQAAELDSSEYVAQAQSSQNAVDSFSNETNLEVSFSSKNDLQAKSWLDVPPQKKALFSFQDVLAFLHPILSVFAPLFKIYQHYKDKGQAPIFLFTLIGIALLVGGFAYLAQLLVGELGAGSKTLLLFSVSTGVIFGSIKLSKLEKFKEFASAGIALGLLLNFVTIYVAGSVYELLPSWLVLLAYFVTALSGYHLSNLYHTKVVSALSLIGGAWIPLVVELQSEALVYYLSGLVLLVCGAVIQGLKREWNWLVYLAAVMSFSCLQWVLGGAGEFIAVSLFAEIFYLLFLAYVHYVLADKAGLSRERLTLLALVIFATIGLCYEALPLNSLYISIIALLNVVVSVALLLKSRHLSSQHGLIHTAIVSVWLLVAIVSSLAPDFWSMAFAVEGLFLLFFAIRERFTTIRLEALALVAFSLLYSIAAVWPFFPSPALLSIKGWALVLSIGATLIASRYVWKKEQNMLSWEHLIFKHLVALESLWLTIIFIATAWLHLGLWASSTLLLLQVILLVRARYHQCTNCEVLALLCMAPIAYCWLMGVGEANSFSLRMLPEFSKIALAVLYLELWLFAEFYRRFYPKGTLAEYAETMRILFYFILPLSFLPSLFKWHLESLAIGLWASAVISYGLGRLVRNELLRIESVIISALACFASLFMFATNSSPQIILPIISLIIGAVYYAYFIFVQRKGLHPSVEKKLASIGLFYMGACISVCFAYYTSVSAGLFAYSVYLFALLLIGDPKPVIKRNTQTFVNCLLLGIPASWLLLSLDKGSASSLYVICNIAVLLLCLFKISSAGKTLSRVLGFKENTVIVFHMIIVLSYLQLFASWDLMLLASPGLIIHGSILLFSDSSNKKLAKMALLYIFAALLKLAFVDAESAILWQKVVLLIGIGCFMLFAAFVYQKRHNKLEASLANDSKSHSNNVEIT
jgi:hypothetical protein